MKKSVRTQTSKTKTRTRIMALIIAMITALSAMSAFTLTASAASEEITYNVSFDMWGYANQHVYIKINGINGSTDWYDAGTINHMDPTSFSFKDKDVGEILSITIHNDMSQHLCNGSVSQKLYLEEWAFKSVTINDTIIYGGRYVTGLDEHTFYVTDNVYKVTIKTADVKNAGTDLNVNVTLNGNDGKKSKTVNMSKDGYDTTPNEININSFERGNQQTTYIYAPFDTLESITIELDGLLIAAKGWLCESITIEQVNGNTDPGVKTVEVNQWFATEKDNYSRTIKIPQN